jgi:hypothetical protein
MEDKLPGMTCDDDGGSDDDDQAPPAEDDDTAATDDDAVPDDYWKCLKDSTDATTCGSAGCTWCVSKLHLEREREKNWVEEDASGIF